MRPQAFQSAAKYGHDQYHFPTKPVPLNVAARCLRIPARWLREKIIAGRLPALIADSAILVHVPTVATLLTEQAKRCGVEENDARRGRKGADRG